MGMLDTGIYVYWPQFDDEGRDLGEKGVLLKEGKKDGVYICEANTPKRTVIRSFDPKSVTVFREADAVQKSALGRAVVGTILAGPVGAVVGGASGIGKKDAWYIEIEEKDGSKTVFRLRNQTEGTNMQKRILKHV